MLKYKPAAVECFNTTLCCCVHSSDWKKGNDVSAALLIQVKCLAKMTCSGALHSVL